MDYLYYYFDESGNSGSRFLDYQQPSYIEGGWVVEKKNIQHISTVITEIESSYPFKIEELKGKQLIKHKRGQELILKMIHEIGRHGGIPILHICEKKYMVCGKIVETFFDPLYNSKIPYADQWNLHKRQKIAQFFYEINLPLVAEFADAYRTKNPEEIQINAQKWVQYLGENNHKELSGLIAHVIPNIKDSLSAEFPVGDDPAFKGIDSLNIPVWFCIFQHIEQNTPSPCSIVHDKIDTFELAYLESFKILKNASEGIIQFKDRRWVYPLKNIDSFFFEDSKESPLVRAADFVVGSSAYYIDLVMSGKTIPELLHKIAFSTLGIFLMDLISHLHPQLGPPLNLGSIIGSFEWTKKLFDNLRHSAKFP
jgi:hypothetical protein